MSLVQHVEPTFIYTFPSTSQPNGTFSLECTDDPSRAHTLTAKLNGGYGEIRGLACGLDLGLGLPGLRHWTNVRQAALLLARAIGFRLGLCN